MLNRLILKVTKFQLPPPNRLGTVVKNILGGPSWPPMSNRVNSKTIYNESSQLLIDPQDKLKHKIEAFQEHYISSFNEGSLNLLLFVSSVLGASFSPLLRRLSCEYGC